MDEQQFSLEDILKEFGSNPDEDTPPQDDAQQPPAENDQPEAAPVTEEVSEEETPATEPVTDDTIRVELPLSSEPVTPVTDDTIRVDTPLTAEPATPVTDDTIRLDAPLSAKGTVRNAQPITEEAEGFPEGWEPDYEQPIEEYVPPQPIIFHPRNRLQELKRKLVNGPEKRYYDLSEKGLGRLQVGMFFSLLVALLCAVTTVMYAFSFVPEERLRLMVFLQFISLLISALVGVNQLIEGVADLFKGRFTLNTMLVATFLACLADGIIGLLEQRIPCCAAFSLAMTMSLWGSYQRRHTEIGQMDTLRKATTLDAVGVREEYYTHPEKKKDVCAAGLLRGEGQVEDFMDHYNEPCKPEKVLQIYALIALGVAAVLGILGGVLSGWQVGVQTFAVSLLAAMPATIYITISRPNAVLESRLHKVGAVLCGWNGIVKLSRPAVFPLKGEDLFPAGTVKLNGMKFFGQADPDEIVAYTTALVEDSGSSLSPLFAQLLESRNGRHVLATEVTVHDNGGVSGYIGDQKVYVGSLSFLRSQQVQIPEGIKVSSAVYVAVEQELCGLFALTYEKDRAVLAGLSALCAYKGLHPVLISDGFELTENFLRNKFSIPAQKVLLPAYENREKLRQAEFASEDPVALLVTKPNLAAYGYAVTGARSLYRACNLGMVIHMLGGILGLGIMLVLTVIGATHLLTPMNMFLYQLLWMLPGLLITEWTRYV